MILQELGSLYFNKMRTKLTRERLVLMYLTLIFLISLPGKGQSQIKNMDLNLETNNQSILINWTINEELIYNGMVFQCVKFDPTLETTNEYEYNNIEYISLLDQSKIGKIKFLTDSSGLYLIKIIATKKEGGFDCMSLSMINID
tara:strand:- start:882 stop:1313 length:432 start_codon:yes stop_codon:yes gene_type:complete